MVCFKIQRLTPIHVPQDPNDEPAEALLERIMGQKSEEFGEEKNEEGRLPQGREWTDSVELKVEKYAARFGKS